MLYLLAELSMANTPGAVTFTDQLMAHVELRMLCSHIRAVTLGFIFTFLYNSNSLEEYFSSNCTGVGSNALEVMHGRIKVLCFCFLSE